MKPTFTRSRKARVRFDARPEFADRGGIHVIHDQHGMRISHGEGADGQDLAVDLKRMGWACRIRLEGDPRWLEFGLTHVDSHLPARFQIESDRARRRADRDLVLVRQTLVADETGEAARPVATLLNLGAVGVEDAVMEVGSGQARRLDEQNLIAADAEAAIGEPADRLPRPDRSVAARRRRRRSRCRGPASW